MGLSDRLSLVVALVWIAVFPLGLVSSCFAQSTGQSEEPAEGSIFRFQVSLRRTDWNTRNFDTYIEIYVDACLYNLSDPLVPFAQIWYGGASYSKQSGAAIPLFSTMEGGPLYFFRGNVTTYFPLVGPTQLYPFDRYMLNMTFVLPLRVQDWNVSATSIINQTNTIIWLNCQVGEFDWTVDPIPSWSQFGPYDPKFSSITYELATALEGVEAGVEWVSLNYKVILFRPISSTNLIIVVLGICYALVGSLPLIKPDRLEHRLSVCLSLFIFAVTFTFTIPVPTSTGTTLAESLILILLTAAGMFSVVSIVEKALIEVRQNLSVCRYLVEGGVVGYLILQLNQSLIYLVLSHAQVPWASLPSTLFASLSISLVYGFVAVTFAFIFNLIRKDKSQISRRVRAIHVFRR